MHRAAPICLLLLACAAPPAGGPSAAASGGAVARPQDDALRRELLTRLEADQAVRRALMRKQQQGQTPDSLDVQRMLAVDIANTAWLKRIVAERGWPGRSVVGVDGANAAFLLVQHADRDTAFQARVLPLLERAYAAGEAEGQQVALLTDRLAIARGAPQVYGSQADVIGGRVVLKPIADSAGVDARRARVGLPPLAEYVRLLDSLYAARPRP
jgi:hypothetical protein